MLIKIGFTFILRTDEPVNVNKLKYQIKYNVTQPTS